MICQTDMLATFADLLGVSLPQGTGEDSHSLLPVLLNQRRSGPVRQTLVTQSPAGPVIREGPWKLIPHSAWVRAKKQPTGGSDEDLWKGQLYNLNDDLRETKNLWDAHPDVVSRLSFVPA